MFVPRAGDFRDFPALLFSILHFYLAIWHTLHLHPASICICTEVRSIHTCRFCVVLFPLLDSTECRGPTLFRRGRDVSSGLTPIHARYCTYTDIYGVQMEGTLSTPESSVTIVIAYLNAIPTVF